MIINLGHPAHPKAEILKVDFRANQVDFRWLNEDESPSEIYPGDCVLSVDLSCAVSAADVEVAVQTAFAEQLKAE